MWLKWSEETEVQPGTYILYGLVCLRLLLEFVFKSEVRTYFRLLGRASFPWNRNSQNFYFFILEMCMLPSVVGPHVAAKANLFSKRFHICKNVR